MTSALQLTVSSYEIMALPVMVSGNENFYQTFLMVNLKMFLSF